MYEVINNLGPNERFWIVIYFATAISVFEAIAQSNLKLYSNGNENKIYLIIGILFYIFVSFTLMSSYRYEGLAHMNLVWSCMSIIIAYIVGVFLFGENINRYTILAIMFAMMAIYFAHRQDEE